MKLAELTSPEVGCLDKSDKVVLIPTGALEQHGDHLPLGVDTYVAEAIAVKLEQMNPRRIILLPAVWMGHSPHHMAFAGTVSVHHQLLADLLLQLISSLVSAGFGRFVVLNAHGGNALPIGIALQELKNRYRGENGIVAAGFQYWQTASAEMAVIRESGLGGMGHACEMETSVMMHLRPELVRIARIRSDGKQPPLHGVELDMLHGSSVSVVYDFHELSESGTFGDPGLAEATKGERFLDAAVQAAGRVIDSVASYAFANKDEREL